MKYIKYKVFEECGCCGQYHPAGFEGDCRDDSNRFTFEQIPKYSIIITLAGQQLSENTEKEV